MLGVIELVMIVVVLGIVASLILASTITSSRIDWSKVFFVFLGLPFLLVIVLAGTYFSFAKNQQMVRAERDMAQAAKHDAKMAEQLARLTQEESISSRAVPEFSEINDDLVRAEPSASETSESGHDSQPAFAMEHQMPTATGRFVESATSSTALLIAIIALFSIVLLACIVGFALKSNHKGAVIIAMVVVSLGFLITGTFTVRVGQTKHPVSATQSFSPARDLDEVLLPTEEIPVGETESEEATPLKVRESRYSYSNGTNVTTKNVSRIPNWAEEAMSNNVIRPDENEIVITSKRYSSIVEAETELKGIASALITDYIVGIYPEMRESWIDASEIKRLGILEHSCEITWPFQVGEFSDEVYQVSWQLDITRNIQEKLYSNWQQEQLTHRLAIVGGGFGLLTLVFGVGAVLTRGKEQEVAEA